ncbi:unnamed protein product [Vicia faba]|uniref:Uncharacterized protein n=1 Tax=Vicia faba TaxID=3906 RepID=A0AAV0ZDP5_VICFA|nr:unnamed protein product [Vicia faba]
MMSYSSQTPPYYSSTPMGNENVPNVGLDEFLDFSTQTTLGGMSGDHGATPNGEDSTPFVGHSRFGSHHEVIGSGTPEPFSTEVLHAFANHVRARSVMRDSNVHHELQADLVKHIWVKFGIFRD